MKIITLSLTVRFSDVFRGERKGALATNGLKNFYKTLILQFASEIQVNLLEKLKNLS